MDSAGGAEAPKAPSPKSATDALRPSQQLWSYRDGQIFSRASLTKR